jgi:hypothetical protein
MICLNTLKKEWFMKINLLTIILVFILIIFPNPILSNSSPELFVEEKILNFGRCIIGDLPSKSFTIRNSQTGNLEGKIEASDPWIILSQTKFNASQIEIKVTLDKTLLKPRHELYLSTISIQSNGGNYELPVRLDLVSQRTTIEMVLDSPTLFVDGKRVPQDGFPRYVPYVRQGKIRLPLRLICEIFGLQVSFQVTTEKEQRYYRTTIQYKDWTIQHTQQQLKGSTPVVLFNGDPITLDFHWEICDGRYYVTEDFFNKTFIPSIQYDAKERKISLQF